MKKLKNLWANNRILLILGIILIVCFIAIIVVVLTYFVGTRKSVYGSRFDNMKTHIKEAEQNSYVQALDERSGVEKSSLRVQGKTLYIRVVFKDDIKLEDAKKIVDESLDKLSDTVKETYDMNFTIKSNTIGTLMGARNVSGNGLSWNNNTPIEKKE